MRRLILVGLAVLLTGLPLPAATSPHPDTNVYESITITWDDDNVQTFTRVQIREIKPDSITIAHATGGCLVPFENLPEAWRIQFGLNEADAAAYRAEQEELARQAEAMERAEQEAAMARQEVDDGSLVIRIDSILQTQDNSVVVTASRRERRVREEVRTNQTAGLRGPTEYSYKPRDEDRYRRGNVRTVSNPTTKLDSDKAKPTPPPVSTISRTVDEWIPMSEQILIVEPPPSLETWSGRAYPCGLAGNGLARYAVDATTALAWKDRKPGWSLTSLVNGFFDALLAPVKVFNVKGMTFLPAASRNVTYWIGILIGAAIYVGLCILALRR